MKDIKKKIGLLKTFVKIDKETGNYYFDIGGEYRDIVDLWYEYEKEVIDLHDKYCLQYLDEAISSYLNDIDEEVLTTFSIGNSSEVFVQSNNSFKSIEDFELDISGDIYTSDLADWLASNNKRVWTYGEDAYQESRHFEGATLEGMIRVAQEEERRDLGRIAKEIIVKYLSLDDNQND